jgi:hypothetical protein
MRGTSKDRPELAGSVLPLAATIVALPCRSGEGLIRRLFEPLGYDLSVHTQGLDAVYPEWGQSPYFTVTLAADTRLADLLSHLYVLIPVLDDDKHYYVDMAEVEKLVRRGIGWLAAHPERELIVSRYLPAVSATLLSLNIPMPMFVVS